MSWKRFRCSGWTDAYWNKATKEPTQMVKGEHTKADTATKANNITVKVMGAAEIF